MREFFKGWKRKTGCLTLLLACLLTAGWVRGRYSYDSWEVRFQPLNVSLQLSSSSDRVEVGIATGEHPRGYFAFHATSAQEVEQNIRERRQREEEHKAEMRYLREHLPEYEWETESEPERDRSYLFGLVDIGRYGGGSGDFPMTVNYEGRCLSTHYVLVVIPLTLLSAWLLVTKQLPVKRPVEPPKD